MEMSSSSSEEGQVIDCHTYDQFAHHFRNGIKLVVINFIASRCASCLFMAPILADFAKTMPEVIFLKINVGELTTVSHDFEVEEMPSFIFLKKGSVIDRVVGARKEELQLKLTKHSSTATIDVTAST